LIIFDLKSRNKIIQFIYVFIILYFIHVFVYYDFFENTKSIN
jgi:hypothetical protein